MTRNTCAHHGAHVHLCRRKTLLRTCTGTRHHYELEVVACGGGSAVASEVTCGSPAAGRVRTCAGCCGDLPQSESRVPANSARPKSSVVLFPFRKRKPKRSWARCGGRARAPLTRRAHRTLHRSPDHHHQYAVNVPRCAHQHRVPSEPIIMRL